MKPITSEQLVACLLLVVCSTSIVNSLDNGLARTPPMGWLAWERFVCELDCAKYPNECINDKLFKDMADRLVGDGYAQAGYKYVNIDDCWSKRDRDPSTLTLVPEYDRFPGGIRKLADYIHGKGLKLGIYGDCGTYTCQKFPGQLKFETNLTDNYFDIDAQTFADWQVDSFKFDGCYLDPMKASEVCPYMSTALNSTGRPILFVCSWPFYEMYAHKTTDFNMVKEKCNVWRYFDDIEDSWQSVLTTVDFFVRNQDTVVKYHGPGHWFDPDQLIIGNYGLSKDEAEAQMAIWAIWSAPLYMSNDLRDIHPDMRNILLNRHVLAINQDPLGLFGLMVQEKSNIQAYVKTIKNPDGLNNQSASIDEPCHRAYAIVYFNRNTLGNARVVSFPLKDLLDKAPLAEVHRDTMGDEINQIIVPSASAASRYQQRSGSGSAARMLQDKLQTIIPRCHKVDSELTYTVYDLFNNTNVLYTNLAYNGNLELRVNLSGVRMVELVPNM